MPYDNFLEEYHETKVKPKVAEITGDITDMQAEIENIKANGDRVHQFVLYDWDDTLLGVVAVPMGYDPRPYINKFVKENLIHPDLRTQTAAQLASLERTDNYRGEYPHTAPDPEDPLRTGGADTVEDGGDYPLTNHLEYCFMGKDLDPEYPYVSGWTEVTQENMADTFTALSANSDKSVPASEFGDMPDDPEAEGAVVPRVVKFDWSPFISGGGYANPVTARLKAVYRQGTKCNRTAQNEASGHSTIGELDISLDASPTLSKANYTIICPYRRINSSGYGVGLVRFPALSCETDTAGTLEFDAKRGNDYIFTMYIRNGYGVLTMWLRNKHSKNIDTASSASAITTIAEDNSAAHEYNGYAQIAAVRLLIDLSTSITPAVFTYAGIRVKVGSDYVFPNAIQVAQNKRKITNCKNAAIAAGQDVDTITYYQLQHYLIASEYLPADEAEAYCRANYEWCMPIEGGDTAE
ncbi:MAG: hypothetical protein IJP94_05485 [Clostridia bacterium]|nr:hypothetical protein [Clostridia bacterium]